MNNLIDALMQRVYMAEAKNVTETVSGLADALLEVLSLKAQADKEPTLKDDNDYLHSLGTASVVLCAALQRLVYADGRGRNYIITMLSDEQICTLALGYLARYHTEIKAPLLGVQ